MPARSKTFVLPSPPNERDDNRQAIVIRRTSALVVALAAFALYHATLLPGVDFGDTGSIQTVVGSAPTPRDGYPLYFAIGTLILNVTGLEPARAMNLASAIEASVACGLFVLVAARLTGSLAAAVAGAMLFGVSYTFWSQAVIAEVYALHASFVLASMLFLLRWEERPTTGRLAAFFACYALGFGNHLSMILLMPAFVVFLFAAAPGGWRSLVAPRIVALAVAIAALGAMQYLWNLRTLWFLPDPPATIGEALQRFWFDVTKSDWRDTMVLNVPQSMLRDHAAMALFDARQQFGIAGLALAAAGAAAFLFSRPRRALLVGLVFAANFAFAFGYNVGDSHVFYLPAHLALALFAAAAIAWRPAFAPAVACALAVYSGVRAYEDFPALDRSSDRRTARVLDHLTAGLDDQRNILLVDLNWQIANGLSYYTKTIAPQAGAVRLRDVLPYAPALIDDNLKNDRSIYLTGPARDLLLAAYGPLFNPRVDNAIEMFEHVARTIPAGTRYAVCLLKPTRDFAIDSADVEAALAYLGHSASPGGDYAVVAGLVGQPPLLVASSNLPFSKTVELDRVPVRVRMESWLASDTIRRMGFGHVIANGRHTLIVERGISFVTFDEQGAAIRTEYFSNIFAEPARHVIP
jgi:hypothetical protein